MLQPSLINIALLGHLILQEDVAGMQSPEMMLNKLSEFHFWDSPSRLVFMFVK